MKTPTTRTEILRLELLAHNSDLHVPVTLERCADGGYVLAIELIEDDTADAIEVRVPAAQALRLLTAAGIPLPADDPTDPTETALVAETGTLILNGHMVPTLLDIAFRFYSDPETMDTTRGEIVLRRQDASRGNLGWLDPQMVNLPADVAESLNEELANMPAGWSGYR